MQDMIFGIYYSPGSRDRYILLRIVDGTRYVYWIGDDGKPLYGQFDTFRISEDEYIGQASELMLALL